MTNDNLQALSDAGVSIWLDDLSRDRLDSGNLAELVKVRNVVGVTTNPTIFQMALSKGTAYDDQLEKLAAAGKNVDETVFALTTDDVRNACDVMASVYDATGGVDGRVSIEVDPRLAHETEKTVEQAKQLSAAVDRDNVLIKIPATLEGLPAITAVLAEGISVNVTLIFSLERYRAVMNAFLSGLEQAHAGGQGPLEDRVGRLVLRLPRRHRDRQAARRHRHRRGQGPQGQGRRRERPAGVPGVRGGLLDPALEVPGGRGRPAAAARCGRRRESRTPPTRTRCTSSTSSPRASSTRCRRRPSTRSPTTARSSATRSPPTTRTPRRSSTTSRRSASPTTTSCRSSRSRVSRSSRSPGASCSAEATEDLEKAAQKAAQR